MDINDIKELPKRKHPRMKDFDYSLCGAYFITICTQNRRCLLSHVVGRGLAPAEEASLELTSFGEIAKQQLFLLKERYPFLDVDQYVIMPNHIHMILILDNETAGASPRPTVMDIICTYKSLTTKMCKEHGFKDKLFQDSFYDHIIRNLEDYRNIAKYIYDNPNQWCYDTLYIKE